jgi:hypothetical protein
VVVAGGLCAVLIAGTTGEIVGLTLVTLGLGAVVLLVFFEIGLSEDRALAEDEERRRKQASKRAGVQRRPPGPRWPRRPG